MLEVLIDENILYLQQMLDQFVVVSMDKLIFQNQTNLLEIESM